MDTTLPHEVVRGILARSAAAVRERTAVGSGDSREIRRQPVHTLYGGAHLFRADSTRKLGDIALGSLRAYAPDPRTFAAAIDLPQVLAESVHARVVEKLKTEPIEDFRIDFEDGYGVRGNDEEDETALSAAREVARGMEAGSLPPFIGIRVKPLTAELGPRAARTLDLFLTTLLDATGGALPSGFVVTNPKVVVPEQVSALAELFAAMEERRGLPAGALRMELMIETPASILDESGGAALPRLVAAAGGRCVAAHFGVYDYTASLGITARHQDLDHPACDFARHMMQVALTDTGIWLSDGATNVMPAPPHRAAAAGSLTAAQEAENRAAVHHGWALHARHVRHSLRHGYYQGWDLNPLQLPTRYAAVYGFFLESLQPATDRLHHFVEQAARATLTGDVFDDAATGQALLNFFLRGLSCGAITEEETLASGLSVEELGMRSFPAILASRVAAEASREP